jgi:xanthine dehydrogenase/oxidase
VKTNFKNFFTATGEPPLCTAFAIPVAIRYALNSARTDAGKDDDWYQLGKF